MEEELARLGEDAPSIPDPVVSAAQARSRSLARTHARAARYRVAVTGLVSLALLGASFTPPGRAATGWLAGIAGVGEEPTLDQAGSVEGSAVVVDSGTLSDGTRYEAVIRRVNDESRDELLGDNPFPPFPEAVCMQIDYPDLETEAGGSSCTTGRDGRGLRESFAHPYETPKAGFGSPVLYYGFVGSTDVQTVRIEQVEPISRELETRFIPIEGELRERLGASSPASVFIAELDSAVVAGGPDNRAVVVATALDADGNEMGTDTVQGPFNCVAKHAPRVKAPPAGSQTPQPTPSFAEPPRPSAGGIAQSPTGALPPPTGPARHPSAVTRPGFPTACDEPIPTAPELTMFRLAKGLAPGELLEDAAGVGFDLKQADAGDRAPLYDPESELMSVDRAWGLVADSAGDSIGTIKGSRGTVFDSEFFVARSTESGGVVYLITYEVKRFTGSNAPEPGELGLPRRFLGVVDPATGELEAFGEIG